MSQPAPKRRRVPEDQRKRAQQSCDLCKKRRCKCVCLPGSDECQTCQRCGQECTWSAPTKTRFHVNIEDLSDRYRCLEAIVTGAFPDEPTNTASELLALGARLNFQMPDLSATGPKKLEELINVHENPPRHRQIPEPADDSAPTTRGNSGEPDNSIDVASHSQVAGARLVHDASGRSHYIAPSGSLSFFAELRDLVSTYQQSPIDGDTSTSKFAMDNIAEALETEDKDQTNPAEGIGSHGGRDITSPGSIISTSSNPSNHLDIDEQIRLLPPHDIMETLISSYFENCHDDNPLFHRASFQDEYESFITSRRAGQAGVTAPTEIALRLDHGWLACLHMILVFGSISLQKMSNASKYTFQRNSVSTASSFLLVLTTKCSLSNIQALLLLCFYFHSNNDRNAAWNLVGTATRMSFALGLHQNDLDSQFRPVEREMRKRIWCTLFTFEQFLCSSLGRPSGIGDPDVEVRVPKEAILDGSHGAGEGFAEKSLSLQYILASARRLMGLRYQTHTASSLKRASRVTARKMLLHNGQAASSLSTEIILKELESWSANLPLHLQLPKITNYAANIHDKTTQGEISYEAVKLSLLRSNPRQLRALILLHIQYQYIIMLVTRPALFVEIATSSRSTRDNGPASPEAATTSSRSLTLESVASAVQISSLVLLLDDFDILNGVSGLDVYYAYCAAMVLLLRTLWVQNTSNQIEIDRETERRDFLLRLGLKLRDVLRKAEKSRTMKRFADVMDKFGDVVGNINNTRLATPGAGPAQLQKERAPSHLPPSLARMGGHQQEVQHRDTPPNFSTPPAFTQQIPLHQSHDQNHNHNQINTGMYHPHHPNQLSPMQGQGQGIPPSYPQWQPINSFPPGANGIQPDHISNGPAVGNMNSIQGSRSFAAAASEGFWYNDPLDALANGQVVDWTELDILLSGQLE